MVFSPDDIMTTTPVEPPLVIVFAPNGSGKSSFIASANNPFVIDTEKKFKTEKKAQFYRPDTFQDVIDCLNCALSQDKLENGIFAIDSLDWVEERIHEKICNDYNVKVVNDDHCKALNFNKGYDLAANMFLSDVYPLLNDIRVKHNIPIVIGAQCVPIKQKEPDKDEYTMQDLRVQTKLANKISDLVEAKVYIQRCDNIDNKGNVIPDNKKRKMITTRSRGINAKNNLHLSDSFDLSWSNGWNDFVNAIGTSKPTN